MRRSLRTRLPFPDLPHRRVGRRAHARRAAPALLLLAALLAGCATRGGGADTDADGLAARLPSELFGLRRGATEAFVLPRLGDGLTVRYAPVSGGAVASVLFATRGEPGITGEDPRQPAADAEFDRMLAEAKAFATTPSRQVEVRELFLVAFRGRPMVRCALLVEEQDGRSLNGLRCLGVAQARFVRVFLTAAPGAMELRRAAGFAALATAVLQDRGTSGQPSSDDGLLEEGQEAVPVVPGPVYRT